MAKPLSLLCLFIALSATLWARPKPEAPAVHNKTWTLCITDADVAGLSPSKAAAATLSLRTIETALSSVNERRRRNEAEIEFYRDIVWNAAKKEAAKKINDKQRQRDAFVFQGNRTWRYKSDLKKADKEIDELWAAFRKAADTEPLIETAPVFMITEQNRNHIYPAPPRAGTEFEFCVQQKIDGFLAVKLSDYYDRVLLEARVYSMFARNWTFEDSILFSIEDLNEASLSLIDALVAEAAQTEPAGIAVSAEPEDAVIMVGGRFAGRGEAEVITRNPGKTNVEVFSDDHTRYEGEIELTQGELTELSVQLSPLPQSTATIEVKDGVTASVYQGALYAGETPLTITRPLGAWTQLLAETQDGKTASASFLIDGSPVIMNPVFAPKEDRVDKARRGFYGAWGRFWIALPITLVLNGMYASYAQAYNTNPYATEDNYNTANVLRWTTIGAGAVAGIFALEFVIRLFYYVGVSNRERSPLAAPQPVQSEAAPAEAETTEAAGETGG